MWKISRSGLVIAFLTTTAFCSQRDPKTEGWAWAKSFSYQDPGGESIEEGISLIHESMGSVCKKLQEELKRCHQPIKNIGLAQFCFLVKYPGDVFRIASYVEDQKKQNRVPLNNHVFISGLQVSKDLKVSESDSLDYAFAKILKLSKSKGAKLSTDELQGGPDSGLSESENSAIEEEILLIDPADADFTSKRSVVQRILTRFKSVSEGDLTLVPKLAREFDRVQKTGDKDARENEVINWFTDAYKKGAEVFHANVADKGVFFSHNKDSEQKLIFYLDYLADLNTICIVLDHAKKVVHKMKEYFFSKSSKSLISGKILRMMKSSSPEMRHDCAKDQRDETKEIARLIEYAKKNITRDEITQSIENLRRIAESVTCILDSSCEKIDKLGKFIGGMVAVWWPFKDVEKDDIGDVQLKIVKEILEEFEKKLEGEFGQKFMKFQADPVIMQLRENAIGIIRQQGGGEENNCIEGLILNIHSRYDCCYCCAPDLAQESIRENGFADYFCNIIQEQNPGLRKPFFRVVASCCEPRADVWPDLEKIEIGEWLQFCDPRDQKTRFYQHIIPDHQVSVHDGKKFGAETSNRSEEIKDRVEDDILGDTDDGGAQSRSSEREPLEPWRGLPRTQEAGDFSLAGNKGGLGSEVDSDSSPDHGEFKGREADDIISLEDSSDDESGKKFRKMFGEDSPGGGESLKDDQAGDNIEEMGNTSWSTDKPNQAEIGGGSELTELE